MGRTLAALLATVILVLAAGASAQPSDRERRARAHFTSATTYFETGDYESAVREFRAAHAEDPRSELLYNIYLCEERLGHPAEAAAALERFLSEIGPDDERRETLTMRLANLRRRADGSTQTQPEAQQQTQPQTQPEAPLEAEPDVVPDVAPEPDAEETREPDRAAEVMHEPDVVRQPPVQIDTGTAPPPSEPPYLAIVGFTVAGAGAITALITGILAQSEDDRLAALCGTSCSAGQVNDLWSLAITTDVALLVAAAGAIVGTVGAILSVTSGAPAARDTAVVVPWIGPHQAGVAVGARL